ncbi:protein MEI2-like 4 isoform X1 [Jatropha curcas]|uniref:protein MEI2-like 4 isoform X1 n=2 Tax=Jatropha curcas TaxID=180498 RepID=UPI0005FC0E28|nr:protein MEI2-like 4 isoform X1 [Jatropha curcas]XP_012088719.1 protein MEI2-like 4 isoform X1 [Jatropha curcas]
MPFETMDLPGLSSSSFFSEDASFPSEKQVGFWKLETMPDHHAIGKSIAMSPMENLGALECQSAKSLELHQSLLMQDQKLNHSLARHVVGTERAMTQSTTLLKPLVHDPATRSVQPTSCSSEGGKVDMMATQYENSLFSSSLSELFSRKLRLSSNNVPYGHSVDIVASHFEEEDPFQSLEEIEAQTIGNLLPSDDDLFSGMTDKLENIHQSTGGDDMEELDFFSSVGGLDLGDDGSAAQNNIECPGGVSNGQPGFSNGSIAGEHPYGEHPSRTLFVRNINSNAEDSELKALFEQYGDIRTLYTSCKHRGFVMISYYDIRAARNAMKALQDRPLRRRKLDIHYSIPKDNPSEKDINQGTLVVFNLDSSISNDELRQIFGVYGEIKEIRETPHRSHHKFIEFYDIRAAESALRALNRSDIAGKRIKLEPSRPGGARRLLQQIPPDLEQDESGHPAQQSSPPNKSVAGFPGVLPHRAIISNGIDNGTILGLPSPTQAPFLESEFHHGISSSVPNSLSSFLRVDSTGNQTGVAEPGHTQGQLKFDIQGTPNFHPHSLPEYHDGLKSVVHSPVGIVTNMSSKPLERIENRQLHRISQNGHSIEFNDGVFGSAINGSSSHPGHHFAWGNSYHHPQSPGMMWPNSSSFVNGISMSHSSVRLHGPPRAPPPALTSVLPINNHHVGSAPTINSSLWERRHAYAGESPESSGFHPGSLGSLRISNNSLHSAELVSPNMFPHVPGNYMDLSIPPKNVGLQQHHQRSIFPGRNQMITMTSPFESPNERTRSRRNEGSINQADKKQFELDIDRILRGEDNRTTLMIKNIPNKYTSKMLLAAIDEHHKGTYDFIYLPIDFKNKCNVGYAFINMIDPSQIIPFYQVFNGKKWEKFNSEKVASLAYARIQGKAALIAHFQNSSLMNEDKRCRPILFNTDGPNAGDQVPFPMGVNVRTRPGKPKSVTNEENHQGSLPNLSNLEDSLNGDASWGSGKESD